MTIRVVVYDRVWRYGGRSISFHPGQVENAELLSFICDEIFEPVSFSFIFSFFYVIILGARRFQGGLQFFRGP